MDDTDPRSCMRQSTTADRDPDGTSGAAAGATALGQLAATTDGTAAADDLGLIDPVDRVAAFGPAILAIRWGTTIASLALAVERYDDRLAVAVWAARDPRLHDRPHAPADPLHRHAAQPDRGARRGRCSAWPPSAPPAPGTRRSSSRC